MTPDPGDLAERHRLFAGAMAVFVLATLLSFPQIDPAAPAPARVPAAAPPPPAAATRKVLFPYSVFASTAGLAVGAALEATVDGKPVTGHVIRLDKEGAIVVIR